MNSPHQITKRDLIEMLAPFADSDKILIEGKVNRLTETVNKDGFVVRTTTKIQRVELFIDSAKPCPDRCAITLHAYEM
jgi:hypothetical protein